MSEASPLHLDLMAAKCQELSLATTVEIDDPAIKTLRDALEQHDQSLDFPWLFGEHYRVDEQANTLTVSLSRSEESKTFDLFVEYEIGVAELYPESPPAEIVFQVIRDSVPAAVACQASFRYSPTDGTSTLPLPVSLGPAGVTPKTLLEGVRLSIKGENSQTDYSITIDRSDDDEYIHIISFSSFAAVSTRLPIEVLDRATTISRALFTPSGTLAQSGDGGDKT